MMDSEVLLRRWAATRTRFSEECDTDIAALLREIVAASDG